MEIDGFLSFAVDTDKKFVIEKYSDFFDYAKDINSYCMAFLKQVKVSENLDSKFIIHTLFLRLLEYFQGVFILLERGMIPPAKVLTKCINRPPFKKRKRHKTDITFYFSSNYSQRRISIDE